MEDNKTPVNENQKAIEENAELTKAPFPCRRKRREMRPLYLPVGFRGGTVRKDLPHYH